MESAIGDYIHLSYAGYVKGPEQGSGRSPFFSNYGKSLYTKQRRFENWVNKQNSPITKTLEQETQKTLNILKNFKEKKSNGQKISDTEQLYIDTLLNDIWNHLDSKYLRIDKHAAVAAGLINSGAFYVGSYTGEGGGSQNKQSVAINNINMQIQNLLNNTLFSVTDSISNILGKEKSIKNIQTAVQKTQINIDNFINQLQNQGKSFNSLDFQESSAILNQMFNELTIAIKNTKELDSIDIEGTLNMLLESLNAGMAANQYKGDISEALVAVMAERLAAVAGSNVQKAFVSGQERSARGINRSYFTSDINWESALGSKKFKQPFGDFIVSADAVQDKVDIKVELSTGRHAYISAKNYSMKSLERGVTNRSASFLTLIQNENDNDFINHYLNLNALRSLSLQSNRDAINQLLKKIIIAKLITGYNTTTGLNGQTMENANVFSVFNSTNYTVKYYDMGDVLQGIFKSGRYQNIKIPEYFYSINIKSMKDAEDRITKIMRRLNVSTSYTLHEEDYAKK